MDLTNFFGPFAAKMFLVVACFMERISNYYFRLASISLIKRTTNKECFWLRLLLLIFGIEPNPGPDTRSGAVRTEVTAKSPTEVKQAAAITPQNPKKEIEKCVFFESRGQECSIARWPGSMELLFEMKSVLDDHENLKLPSGFTERDLILDRLRSEHSEVPIQRDLQLCPEHRDMVGLGYINRKKRAGRKGIYGNCQWKTHLAGADRLLTYPMRWQMAEREVEREKPLVLGMPVCNRCYYDQIKPNVKEDEQYNLAHYNGEKNFWSIFAKLAQQLEERISSPTGIKRLATIKAEERIREIAAARTPETSFSSSEQRALPESPPFPWIEPKDRLETFNRSMKEISNLAGQEWKDIPYLLDRPLEDVAESTARKLRGAATRACLAICNVMTNGQELELFGQVAQQVTKQNISESRQHNQVLKTVIDAIENARNINERVALVSQICEEYSGNQLQAISPAITAHVIRLARNHREEVGIGLPVQTPKIVRHKLDMAKASHFFSWIFDKGFVQFMSWGVTKMQYTSGEEEKIGRVILQNNRSNLIRLYLQDCATSTEEHHLERPFEPLHPRTLFKLLETVKFSERRAMSGLDNTAVATAEAWKSLSGILEKLRTYGMTRDNYDELIMALKAGKVYLQGQYLVDVSSETSNCAYHCRRLALSDVTVPELRSVCDDHNHDKECPDCELLLGTIQAIDQHIDEATMPEEVRAEFRHDFDIASQAIHEQMAHIIRGVHQDQAKKSALATLDEKTGFVVFDYAMKWLPAYYRESQSEWFGKKGVSWEVFTFMAKQNGERVKATYVVFISNCDQNVATSAGIYREVVKQIKSDFPQITQIYDKSDNAKCFRNWKMLRERRAIMQETGIRILETINNEPQRGKDIADSDIALIKSQLKSYQNSGHNVVTAADMKIACDAGSIRSVKSALINGHLNRKTAGKVVTPRGPPITSLHSFRYEENGVRVWHFHQIGTGVLIPYKDMPAIAGDQRTCQVQTPFSSRPPIPSVLTTSGDRTEREGVIWLHCDFPFCTAKFRSMTRYEDHIINADHSKLPTKETTSDLVKHLWIKVQESKTLSGAPSTRGATAGTTDVSDPCPEGFALRVRRAPKRLNEKQKSYLSSLFWDGQLGKSVKANPGDVARQMRQMRDDNGKTHFSSNEWLTEGEISRFFSRMAASVKTGKALVPIEEIASDDEEAQEAQRDEQATALTLLEIESIPTREELMAIDESIVAEEFENLCGEMGHLDLGIGHSKIPQPEGASAAAAAPKSSSIEAEEPSTSSSVKPKQTKQRCAPETFASAHSAKKDSDSDDGWQERDTRGTKMKLRSQKEQSGKSKTTGQKKPSQSTTGGKKHSLQVPSTITGIKDFLKKRFSKSKQSNNGSHFEQEHSNTSNMSLKDLRKVLIGMPRTTLEWDAALSIQLPDVPQEAPDKPPTASLELDGDLFTKFPNVPQELPVKLLTASLEWDADLFPQLADMPREISSASANISAASLEWDADLLAKLPNVPEDITEAIQVTVSAIRICQKKAV